ncbi:MAG: type IX secretion system protein PorQ [Bacteroidaceae bacterium]|jgi:hypothetical protein|nr:type IX secretion system protein PorQ [Bacteroidaceae bacterium]
MKKGRIILILLCLSQAVWAQEGSSIFNFLKIPVSAHAAALGGDNVSLKLDDPTLIFGNPATAAQINDMSFNLNYMTYLGDTKVVSASAVKVFSVRHTVGLTTRLFDYGSMDETDENGNVIGSFSAKDMALSALYSYTMGNGLVGGASLSFINSKYAEYSATSVAVDLGLHYYNDSKDFSAGLVLKNIGTQISSFYDDRTEHLPFDLQAGITHKIQHAPFRFSITLKDLTRWSQNYYFNPEGKNSLGRKIFNHVVVGADFLPTDNTYIALGYNVRRGNELKAAGAGHGAGWSFGGGLQMAHFKLGISYAKYHVDVSSLLFNLSYSL